MDKANTGLRGIIQCLQSAASLLDATKSSTLDFCRIVTAVFRFYGNRNTQIYHEVNSQVALIGVSLML